MATFDIPWKCLATDAEPTKTIIDQTKDQLKAHKTFAQALTNICEFPLSQIPQPVVKGDRLAIQIPEKDYIAGIDACKQNLHGRIIWPKGSTSLSVVVVKRGLDLCFLEYFAWTHDFNPRAQHNSSAQVWVKIFGLAQEYWRKNIIFTIASSIGTPICTDAATAKPMIERTFGQFARVLVDIDLAQPLRYKILVERKGFAFFVELDYEHIPNYCTGCKVIGHNVDNCRWNKEEEIKGTNEVNQRKKPPTESKKVFVQTRDGREQQEETLQVKYKDQGNDTGIVLNPEDIFKQQDKELEEELNSEHEKEASKGKTPSMDEDASSNGSFVAATQSLEDELFRLLTHGA
ncbi:hypothetical protein TSUD_90440 [Trifolium subterraneum]|uniref:DUF4283 domain-containing protein n=1 Tax=Trifolium subterraneum TaxID=3900 RepID=A0A2Z6M8R7_TRISU|nr:hypothetical protein TSUD_90440 [Trifolium subterraneum]